MRLQPARRHTYEPRPGLPSTRRLQLKRDAIYSPRIIPLSEAHLRRVLRSWIAHYNRGRPHMALGPGVPDPPAVSRPMLKSHHSLDGFGSVQGKAVLGGLHHEYSLCPA